MAYTEGTLLEGFSRASIVPSNETGAFILNVLPGQGFDRLTRLGTVLQVDPGAALDRYNVSRVFKLFGSGIIAGTDPAHAAFGISSEVWVRLFVPSMQYWLFSQ